MKKIVSLILVAVMLFAFASCGEKEFAIKYKNTVMTEPEYSYWFSTLKTQMLATYNNGIDSEDFWSSVTEDGLTYEEILTDSVNTQIASILVSTELFDEYGLSLTDANIEAIDADIADKLDHIGSRSEMNEELGKFGLNIDILREVYINSAKVSAVREYLFGSAGINAPTNEDIAAYFADNYRAIKMVVIYTGIEITTDDEGNYVYDESGNLKTVKLSDEEKATKAMLVEAVVDAIESGADIDECIKEFSEVDYTEYPNGFFISRDSAYSYGSDVVDAAWSMEIGDVAATSDDVMTFIIYREEMPEYSSLTSSELELVSDMKSTMINEMINEMYAPLIEKVAKNEDILGKFDINEAHKNSYY